MTEQQSQVPSVYMLTTITGRRRNDDREAIVMSFEMRRKTLLLTLLGLAPASFVGMVAALFIGSYGLLVGAAALGAWSYLVLHQSRTGLRLVTWRALLDKRAARAMQGNFIQCGEVVLAGSPEPVQVLQSMVFLPDDMDAVSDLLTAAAPATSTNDAPTVTRRNGRTDRASFVVDTSAFDN